MKRELFLHTFHSAGQSSIINLSLHLYLQLYHLKKFANCCFLSYIYTYYAIICIYHITIRNMYAHNRMGSHAGPIVFQFSSFAAILNVIFSVSLFFHAKFEELKYALIDKVILFRRACNNDYPSASPDKERPELHALLLFIHIVPAYYVIA